MTRSESLSNLATALAKAQAEMPVAAFDATNPFLKSKYATLGAVIQASRPILAKHRLSLVQFPINEIRHLTPALSPIEAEREKARGDGGSATGIRPSVDYIGIESILTHESGEFVAERILIPLSEEKGKSKVQSAGSTLTYLRRYSWASILGMYSDEDTDATNLVVGSIPEPPAKHFPHGPVASGKSSISVSPKPAAALPPPPLHKHSNN
jgi:hypothetical protein